MFGEHISPSPPTASPWSVRFSTSASTSASTTAPPTPPSHRPFGELDPSHPLETANIKQPGPADHPFPALHLLNMSCDDALSDVSDEADGFFSLDMDVSIDQQLQDQPSYTQAAPTLPSLSERLDPSPLHANRQASRSPLLNPTLRRASETAAYSSSPLQAVGLDPIMASRSRPSPIPNGNTSTILTGNGNTDVQNASSPSSFGPIAPEVDQKGNLEYKLKILPPSRERFDRLVTQLKWRLLEGGGHAIYEIGVLDDGTLIGLDLDSMKDSLKLLSLMAAEVGANCFVQRALVLEKVATPSDVCVPFNNSAVQSQIKTSSRLATADTGLSLRALAPTEATNTLQPYILTAVMEEDARTELLESGAAGLYRFDIADQQMLLPPSLANLTSEESDAETTSIAAVDPTESASFVSPSEDDAELALSAQTRRRLLKATAQGLPCNREPSASTRTKRDILQGLDPSAVVYLPSKEEKRILRAAAEAAELGAAEAPQLQQDAAERALSHTEAQERKMMAKMTRVADSVQPKTARARARARKSAGDAPFDSSLMTPSCSASPSSTPSPSMKAVNAPTLLASPTGAYTGYENVMSTFGVLSERAAKTLYDQSDMDVASSVKGRLIVEAVVRRDIDSEHNSVDFQGAKSKLKLDARV